MSVDVKPRDRPAGGGVRMDEAERLGAIDDIRQAKSCYFRGVDTNDAALVRSVLAEDCVLDYRGCCTDPKTGRDYLPGMNVVMQGPASWPEESFGAMGITSVHQGHNFEVDFTGEDEAQVIWSMTDRLFMPPGGEFSAMTGYGHYHETYRKIDSRWKISRLRISRLRVEAA